MLASWTSAHSTGVGNGSPLSPAAGRHIWLDTLSRDLLDTGEFARLVDRRHVTGATSNPTIFAKTITSDSYTPQLRQVLAAGESGTRENSSSPASRSVKTTSRKREGRRRATETETTAGCDR